jgi:hypothetical protein
VLSIFKGYLLQPVHEGFDQSPKELLSFAVVEGTSFVKFGLALEPLDDKVLIVEFLVIE